MARTTDAGESAGATGSPASPSSYLSELLRIVRPGDPRIAEAFGAVDRADFVEGFFVRTGGTWDWVDASTRPLPPPARERIYRNEALTTLVGPTGLPASSSSMPALMMRMLDRLDVAEGARVLEIGAGTGYNAALLARLVGERGRVVTVDIDADVVAQATRRLRQVTAAPGFGPVDVLAGDGAVGHPETGPYDRLIATAGCPTVPVAWWDQLAPTGGALIPLALGGTHPLALLHKGDRRGEWTGRYVGHANFMVALGDGLGRTAGRTVRLDAGTRVETVDIDVDPRRFDDLVFFTCLERPASQPLRMTGGGLGRRTVAGGGLTGAGPDDAAIFVGNRLYAAGHDALASIHTAIDIWHALGRPALARYRTHLAQGGVPAQPPADAMRCWSFSRGDLVETVFLSREDTDDGH